MDFLNNFFSFGLMGGGVYRDQPGPGAQGQGMVWWCRLVCMHVRGWGGARRLAVMGGVGGAGGGVCAQLITAMHCTAHVPRAYRDRTLFRAFLPL